MGDEFALSASGDYVIPPDGDYESTLDFIQTLPMVAAPEVFGMHPNADITKDNNDTEKLLSGLMLTEGGGGGGGGGSTDDKIDAIATDILSKLPEDYDMEEAAIKYPVRFEESMNTVLCQELGKFNKLLRCIRTSLKNIKKAVKGQIVMSGPLEALGQALIFAKIPEMWKKAPSYPSLKPVAGYVSDLIERCEFFNSWLKDKPPPVYWISGFFFTQAFVTGAKQNFARKFTIPIDAIEFDYEIMPKDSYRNPPRDGVYTYGFFLEGCRWDKKTEGLAESQPKVLFSPAPIIWFKPIQGADLGSYPHYACPTYKTSERKGVLATTGHSSNFICFIRMPSNMPQAHWIQRGAAMLS